MARNPVYRDGQLLTPRANGTLDKVLPLLPVTGVASPGLGSIRGAQFTKKLQLEGASQVHASATWNRLTVLSSYLEGGSGGVIVGRLTPRDLPPFIHAGYLDEKLPINGIAPDAALVSMDSLHTLLGRRSEVRVRGLGSTALDRVTAIVNKTITERRSAL